MHTSHVVLDGRTDGRAVEAVEGVRTNRWQHWSDWYHLSSSDGSGGDGTEKILMGKRRCCVQDADENPLISHPPRAHPCCVLFHARAPLSRPIASSSSSSSCVLFRRCLLKWDVKGMDTWDAHTLRAITTAKQQLKCCTATAEQRPGDRSGKGD